MAGACVIGAFLPAALSIMLNLVNLRTLLSKVLSPPTLHTVALFTPEGELICCETDAYKTKDRVRVIVGLSTEVWQETKEQNDMGMVDSEVRLPVACLLLYASETYTWTSRS